MMELANEQIDFTKKPRDQNILIGHEQPYNYLKSLWEQKKISPVWLVYGQKGIGKTTFVYKLAKEILFLDQGHIFSSETIAKQIAAKSYPNLVSIEPEINADGKLKTVITIDQVMKIFPFLQNSPTIAGWRIVIIDNADQLNSNAANCLLKILEEPPKQTLIFLISQSKTNILPTIRSRSQYLYLKSDDNQKSLISLNHLLAGSSLSKQHQFDVLKVDDMMIEFLRALAESMKGNLNGAETFIKSVVDNPEKFDIMLYLIPWWAHYLSLSSHRLNCEIDHQSFQKAQEWFLKRYDASHWLDVTQAVNKIITTSKTAYLDKKHLLFSLFFSFESPKKPIKAFDL